MFQLLFFFFFFVISISEHEDYFMPSCGKCCQYKSRYNFWTISIHSFNRRGIFQAQKLQDKFFLLYGKPKQVFSSSAIRAKQTASIAFPEALVIEDDPLVEQSVGIYEQKLKKEVLNSTIIRRK